MKRTAALICLLLCAALLCSCAGSAPAAGPDESADAPDDIELTLAAFPVGNWGNPTAVSNILAGFHREYPNIHISVEYLSYDTGDAEIERAVREGRPPDLVLEGPERLVASWGEKGWMADLSELMQSERAVEIYPKARAACRNSDGVYYEFPICMSAHCMAINYDLFRDAGALQYIDEENHTWTTDGFIEAVHALTEYGMERAGIVYCKNQSGDQGTRALVNNLFGGEFTDHDHKAYKVDSGKNRRALELLYDLEGISFEPSLTSSDAIELFCKRETAMCFCWNASIEVLQTINSPDLDFDVFPIAFPTSAGRPRLQGGIWGFGVFDSGSGERIEAAKTFIRYISENDAVYRRAVLTSSYWPVRDAGNIYENDILMTEYSIFTQYLDDYYQITSGWADARTAWWQLLSKIADGADVSEAVMGFPAPE